MSAAARAKRPRWVPAVRRQIAIDKSFFGNYLENLYMQIWLCSAAGPGPATTGPRRAGLLRTVVPRAGAL